MFSESKAAGPVDQRGFKPHMPHFLPWLCGGLKAHQPGRDLGLRGAFRRSTEPHLEDLAPRGRTKEKVQAGDKEKHRNSLPRANGMGLARRLPLVLRGRHILSESLGKTKDDGSGKRHPSSGPVPNKDSSGTGPPVANGPQDPGSNGVKVQDFCSGPSPAGTPGRQPGVPSTAQNDGVSAAQAPVPAAVTPGRTPGQAARESADEDNEKLSRYLRSAYRQRDPTFSSWVTSSAGGTVDRRHGFRSSSSRPHQTRAHSPGHGDPAVGEEVPGPARFSHGGSFKGDVFSGERPRAESVCTRTLPSRRKPRPRSELIRTGGPEPEWVSPGATGAVDLAEPTAAGPAAEPGPLGPLGAPRPWCHRKAVRSQIKRVVVNLEQVVGALRNVQQEMKEVVEQIDHLTTAIDLNAQEEQRKMEAGEGAAAAAEGGGGGRVTRPPSGSGSTPPSSSTPGRVPAGGGSPPSLQPSKEKEEEEAGSPPLCNSSLRKAHRPLHPAPPRDRLSPAARPSPCTRTAWLHLSDGGAPRRGAPPSYGHLALHASSPINRGGQSQAPPPLRGAALQSLAPPPRGGGRLAPRRSTPRVTLTPDAGAGPAPPSPPPPPSATPSPASPRPDAVSPSLPSPVATPTPTGSAESPPPRRPSAAPPSPSPSPSPLPALPPPAPGTPPPGPSKPLLARRTGRGPGVAAGRGRGQGLGRGRAENTPARGRRGRKPPPYPHSGGEGPKEPRQAPPYPEKRTLLSTIV